MIMSINERKAVTEIHHERKAATDYESMYIEQGGCHRHSVAINCTNCAMCARLVRMDVTCPGTTIGTQTGMPSITCISVLETQHWRKN